MKQNKVIKKTGPGDGFKSLQSNGGKVVSNSFHGAFMEFSASQDEAPFWLFPLRPSWRGVWNACLRLDGAIVRRGFTPSVRLPSGAECNLLALLFT